MDTTLIASLELAITTVLAGACNLQPRIEKPMQRTSRESWGAVTGIIALNAEEGGGSLAVSFEESTVLAIATKMIGETFDHLNEEAIDAIGELTNMICGVTKRELAKLGYDFVMARPEIIKGAGVPLPGLRPEGGVRIPFHTPHGRFVVETDLCAERPVSMKGRLE